MLQESTTVPSEAEVIEDVGSALTSNTVGQWIRAAVIVAVAIVLARIARVVVGRLLVGGRSDTLFGDLVGRLLGYLILAFGLVYGLDELGVQVGPILGALGVIGLALAFALQSVLSNFVAGVLLQLRRPFERGDEITSLDYTGRVLSIDSRTMTILTLDGETVRLPNAEVIDAPIVNLTKHGKRRTRVDVGIAYGSDVARASEVARQAAAGVEGVLTEPAATVQAFAFGESSIDLAVRVWHEPSITTEWAVRDQVIKAVAGAFTANEIEIPFPQRVVHLDKD